MKITDRKVDFDIGNLARQPPESAPVGTLKDDVGQLARGTGVLGGPALNVVSTMDLAKLLAQLGLKDEEQRHDLMQQRLSNALTIMLGQLQIVGDRQQQIVNDINDCEKKIKELETDKLAALHELENDPEVIRIQIEIEKLNQMINSLKTTPEERKAAQERKEKLEKQLAAKVQAKEDRVKADDARIAELRSRESSLIGSLNPGSVQAIFSAISAAESMARRRLADDPKDQDATLALSGAENLAVLLGKSKPDELAKFNRMLEDLAVRRSETAYA